MIQEYKCTICEHVTERLQKSTDPPMLTCPMCEQDRLVKVISAGVFDLKGSGFYKGGIN